MRKSRYTMFMLAIFTNKWVETFQRVNNNEANPEVNMDSVYIMLTSSIYKINNKELDTVKNEDRHKILTVISPDKLYSNDDKKETSHQKQKATLGDVLMMKLVSYYEDKYKVADHEPTERGTKTPVLSENDILGSENKDVARIGFETKNIKSVMNIMDVPEVVIA